MAKKGPAVQLQVEINNDEEWEQFLKRDGLLVVDVYSEWCGPCSGMVANLKKIKLEFGGDQLHLAIAKSDTITQLERFRNKSEPTWMFISNGKMVNLVFGADVPKLTRLILDELKLEALVNSGQKERDFMMEITDLTEEEQIRFDEEEEIKRLAKEKEAAKVAKELLDRRTLECQNILSALSPMGTIIIFPNARTKYQEVMADLVSEAGLLISQNEKVKISEEMLEELLFFGDTRLTAKTVEDITGNKLSLALLMKRSSENLSGDIDEVVLQMVYGNSRRPPGDERSPSQKLLVKSDEQEEEANTIIGVWAPPNSLAKATALKLLFPTLTAPYRLPETEPSPLYVAVAYDAFKARDVMELSTQYPGQVMAYGFFTSDIPAEAQLIAKTVQKFEERTVPTT